MRSKLLCLLAGIIVGISPLLMAPTGGGMPSRPRFQAVGVGVVAGAAGTVTATNFIGNVGGIATSDLARKSVANTFTYNSSSSADPGQLFSSARPVLYIDETDTSDNYVVQSNGGDFRIDAINDAGSTLNSAFTIASTAGVVDSITFGAPTLTTGKTIIANTTDAGGGTLRFQVSGASKAYFGLSGSWEGDSTVDAMIAAETGGGIRFYVNGSATEAMTISSTGIAEINGRRVPKTAWGVVNFSGSTCSIAGTLSNSGLGSCTYSSAGVYFVTIDAGFSTRPTCVASVYGASLANFATTVVPSASEVDVYAYTHAGAAVDAAVNVVCHST